MVWCRYSAEALTVPNSTAKTTPNEPSANAWLCPSRPSVAVIIAITMLTSPAGMSIAHHTEVDSVLRASATSSPRSARTDQAPPGAAAGPTAGRSVLGADITGHLLAGRGRPGRG